MRMNLMHSTFDVEHLFILKAPRLTDLVTRRDVRD